MAYTRCVMGNPILLLIITKSMIKTENKRIKRIIITIIIIIIICLQFFSEKFETLKHKEV